MQSQLSAPTAGQAREGSPWTGLWAVVAKEMADYLTSTRMLILELLTVLTAAGTVFSATQSLRESPEQNRFLFLQLFTASRDPLPAFVVFLGFLVPLIAIALAFDAINAELNGRTLSRVLAQPIYRDALLFGKFLAGLLTLSLVLATIWLLIMQMELALTRISPNTLFAEAVVALLNPGVRSLGIVLPFQLEGAIMGTALPLGQSLLLMWPHLTALIAETLLLFALGYVLFQRREIRA